VKLLRRPETSANRDAVPDLLAQRQSNEWPVPRRVARLSQAAHDVAHITEQQTRNRMRLSNVIGRPPFREPGSDIELKAERRQMMPERVVQVPRDPQSLLDAAAFREQRPRAEKLRVQSGQFVPCRRFTLHEKRAGGCKQHEPAHAQPVTQCAAPGAFDDEKQRRIYQGERAEDRPDPSARERDMALRSNRTTHRWGKIWKLGGDDDEQAGSGVRRMQVDDGQHHDGERRHHLYRDEHQRGIVTKPGADAAKAQKDDERCAIQHIRRQPRCRRPARELTLRDGNDLRKTTNQPRHQGRDVQPRSATHAVIVEAVRPPDACRKSWIAFMTSGTCIRLT
jgi:hypothetical protein